MLVSCETGKKVPLSANMKVKPDNGSFSPDGRPAPAEANGVDTAGELQISPSGGNQPVWRGDGREILYVGPGATLMSVPIEIGAGGVRPMFSIR